MTPGLTKDIQVMYDHTLFYAWKSPDQASDHSYWQPASSSGDCVGMW